MQAHERMQKWAYEHIAEVTALVVGLTYITIPYIAYYEFFRYFHVSLDSVGFDRGEILTRAAVSILFTLAIGSLAVGLTVAALWTAGLLFFLAIALFGFVVLRLAARAVKLAGFDYRLLGGYYVPLRRKTLAEAKRLGMEPLHVGEGSVSFVPSDAIDRFIKNIENEPQSNRVVGPQARMELESETRPIKLVSQALTKLTQVSQDLVKRSASWLQETRRPLRTRIAWLIGGAIVSLTLTTFIRSQTPEWDGVNAVPYSFLLAASGLWLFVVLCDFLIRIPFKDESLRRSVQDAGSRAGIMALQGAVAANLLLLLVLSAQLGSNSAEYVATCGKIPPVNNGWRLLDVDARLLDVDARSVTVKPTDSIAAADSSQSPKKAPSPEPRIYLGESSGNVVLYDTDADSIIRASASNIVITSVPTSDDEKSPCATDE